MAEHLPDPAWAGAMEVCPACKLPLAGLPQPVKCPSCGWKDSEACLRCGYSLAGTVPPAPCPECGEPHDSRQFIVYGVPQGTGESSVGRGLLVGGGLIVLAIYTQAWAFVGVLLGWYAALAIGLILIFAMIAIVRTGAGPRGGSSRFVFTSGGIGTLPLKEKSTDEQKYVYISWRGDEAISLKKVSNVWFRLIVRIPGARAPVFDAGIRCPQAQCDELRTVVQDFVLQHAERTHRIRAAAAESPIATLNSPARGPADPPAEAQSQEPS